MALSVGPLPPPPALREAAAAATAERTAEADAAGSWAGQGAADPGPDPFWVWEDEAMTAAVEAEAVLGVGEALRRRAYSCIMDAGGPGGGGSTLKPVLALQRRGRKVRYLQ